MSCLKPLMKLSAVALPAREIAGRSRPRLRARLAAGRRAGRRRCWRCRRPAHHTLCNGAHVEVDDDCITLHDELRAGTARDPRQILGPTAPEALWHRRSAIRRTASRGLGRGAAKRVAHHRSFAGKTKWREFSIFGVVKRPHDRRKGFIALTHHLDDCPSVGYTLQRAIRPSKQQTSWTNMRATSVPTHTIRTLPLPYRAPTPP